ncbi:flagellar biosynthesis regulator FlaF [Magnetospirillum sulfuroxidans]|uniref:Flagellar biosynthesis regulator FlaF n=1 Tax=Magnetospirillum sulfuroxidans TaxID=611300 RepID=A0ABS5IAA1_9PROT|nr:flagellar biosynthesis regulator FlaF [Magnetospirillum sulfuroxidans]MBR9971350.1 flagellar biosynthesis regulator FlaF [Magnetospirillum sulfuroxidans]
MAYPNYGQSTYKSMPQPGNPRETEAWALTESARRMSVAKQADISEDDMLAAVRLNWRLWTIFQAELAGPECALPLEMRQDMLSLCNFVDKRTVEIIADSDRSKLDILVNINRQIAAGLFTVPPPAEGETAEQGVPTPLSTNDMV